MLRVHESSRVIEARVPESLFHNGNFIVSTPLHPSDYFSSIVEPSHFLCLCKACTGYVTYVERGAFLIYLKSHRATQEYVFCTP